MTRQIPDVDALRRPRPPADPLGFVPQPALAPQDEPEAGTPTANGRSVREVEVEVLIRALLLRVDAQERLAEDAQSDLEDFFGWPSWSMDTGLTPAQEKFVEHWSPRQVLEDSRSVRELVQVLQRWTGAHRDDASLDDALNVLTSLLPR